MRKKKLFIRYLFIILIALCAFQLYIKFDSHERLEKNTEETLKEISTEGKESKKDLIEIPYDFSSSIPDKKSYKSLEKRILQFDRVTEIGKDESNDYSMYMIELGKRGNPTLLVIAGMHGTEWQGPMYSMRFMEELRDDTFPDKEFRDQLINKFHIVYIPVVNPWGFDHAKPYKLYTGRYNTNDVELNNDFDPFTQVESQNVKTIMDIFEPFAFLDIHMMQSKFKSNYENNIVIGNGQHETDDIFDRFADSLSTYAEQPVTQWRAPPFKNPMNTGLARTYMRDQSNPHTPHTLSYIIELTRPIDRTKGMDAPLSNREIMRYGMAGLYLFFQTSIEYYEEENKAS